MAEHELSQSDCKVAEATANGGCEGRQKLKSIFYTEIKVHKHPPFNNEEEGLEEITRGERWSL